MFVLGAELIYQQGVQVDPTEPKFRCRAPVQLVAAGRLTVRRAAEGSPTLFGIAPPVCDGRVDGEAFLCTLRRDG